jgi:pimeloyl-ACP methyl ester carboxylesterase
MVWLKKADLRGPKGRDAVSVESTRVVNGRLIVELDDGSVRDAGPVAGPQGLPGANAVPTDQAVGAYISTEGESATKTAVAQAINVATVDRGIRQARLADTASADRTASLANSTAQWQDGAAFTETWSDYSAWSASTRQQLKSGRTYANGSGGASGICHGFQVGAGQTARMVFDVSYVYDSSDSVGGVIVGVTSDAVGANMEIGAGTARGLYFSGQRLYRWDRGTSNLLFTFAEDARFVVTLIVEASIITITAHSTDDEIEVRTTMPRGTSAINNIGILATDSRGTAGMSVGTIGARTLLPTTVPHAPEELAVRAHWTPQAAGNVRIAFPTNYDSRKPSPVVLCFHGAGGNELTFAPLRGSGTADTNQPLVAEGFLAAGYVVVSVGAANPTTFGSDAGLAAYLNGYRFFRDSYSMGLVVVYGNSMGGLESLLTLSRDAIPARAWCATSPVCNLGGTYANPTFTDAIRSSYGIAADDSDYAALTDRHDPVLLPPTAFRGIPMMFIAASDDTVIPKATNTDVLAPAIAATGSPVTVITATGDHGFDHTPYLARIVAFFDAAIGR